MSHRRWVVTQPRTTFLILPFSLSHQMPFLMSMGAPAPRRWWNNAPFHRPHPLRISIAAWGTRRGARAQLARGAGATGAAGAGGGEVEEASSTSQKSEEAVTTPHSWLLRPGRGPNRQSGRKELQVVSGKAPPGPRTALVPPTDIRRGPRSQSRGQGTRPVPAHRARSHPSVAAGHQGLRAVRPAGTGPSAPRGKPRR